MLSGALSSSPCSLFLFPSLERSPLLPLYLFFSRALFPSLERFPLLPLYLFFSLELSLPLPISRDLFPSPYTLL
jgi:hypothetical protein